MYKLFVDDSWSKDYIDPYNPDDKNFLREWNDENIKWLDNNFFVLAWVHIKTDDIKWIDEDLKNLKLQYFWTKKVEIKSTYLRNPKNRKKYYLDKYNISNENLNKFWEWIYEILEKYKDKFLIFSVVFDKRQFKYRDVDNNNILLKSVQVLFERIEKSGYLTKIVFDQMDKSLRKTSGDNGKILEIFNWKNKKVVWYCENYKNILDIEFQKSDNENLLQIADLIAYNIRRQFMQFWKIMIEWWSNYCEDYLYFAKISENFYKKYWKVMSYGLALYPNWNKINWQFSSQ